MGRTDRVLISIALLLLLLTVGSLVGFDDWFGPLEPVGQGEGIAEVMDGRGDVRVKFSREFQWEKGRNKQKLNYEDAVFSGENSSVNLKIGHSNLRMGEQTLVVLREERQFKTLNLSRGMLTGLIAKDDRLQIETANGEKIQLSASQNTEVAIERRGAKTSVKVLTGRIQVAKEGKVQSLATADKLELVDLRPKKNDPIRILSPEKGQFYSADARVSVDFSWAYSSGNAASPSEIFVLEFAQDSAFKRITLRESFTGHTGYSTSLPLPQTFYYRVKDTRGNFSVAKKLTLSRPEIPKIVMPYPDREFLTHRGELASVLLALQFSQPGGRARLQLARDAEYKEMVLDEILTVQQKSLKLDVGSYFVRARAEFEADQIISDWSETVAFSVREKVNPLDIKRAQLRNHVLIPNLNYASSLYGANKATVQNYLATGLVFQNFFEDLKFAEHRLMVKRRDQDNESEGISGGQYPSNWIYPGLADLVYHVEAADGTRFPARNHRLLIEMEAPNQLNEKNGLLSWSRILFAEGYEAEVRGVGGFKDRIQVTKNWVAPVLAADSPFSFRVRALGQKGIPISGWSAEHRFRTPRPEPEIIQSENILGEKEESVERKPAQDDATKMVRVKRERKADEASLWEKIGGWLWGGTGYNFVNVRQTIANTADVEYKNSKGPSAYLEAGWMGRGKFGAVVSYKRTPGEVTIANYPVNKRDFVWTTSSAEGLWATPWRMKIFDIPVLWTLRAGVQAHYFPFLYVDTGNQLIQGTNNMVTGTIGFLTETMTKKLRYYWSMRYQQPLTSGSEGGNSFTVTPVIAFDGSLGASYNFNPRWKAGAFWYGQLHSYQFNYVSATQSNAGVQNLFYSNMELRLGVDF